jgi:hypothetical protein
MEPKELNFIDEDRTCLGFCIIWIYSPHFLDHELGKKFLSYVLVDMIFSFYVRMAAVSTEPGFYLSCWNMKTACMCMISLYSDQVQGLDDLGFESWQRQEIYLIFKMSRLALRPNQVPIQWIWVCLPGAWPGHEAGH